MTFSTSSDAPGLKKPNNVFEMQNKVSDDLNVMQDKYSRYIRCQNEETANDVSPPCDLNGSDSFRKLSGVYDNLYSSLDNLQNVYDKQVIDGKSNESYKKDERKMKKRYEKIRKMREKLDNQLKAINENVDHRTSPSKRNLESRILINTLLLILLVYLIYIIFFDLM